MAPVEEIVAHPARTAWEAGWTYPLKGAWFFLTHPFLWPLLRGRLLPCAILTTIVLFFLFTFTYLPQVAFMYIITGFAPGAWINGTFLVLSEGAAVVAILFEAFFVDETLCDVFDAVLVARGREDLVRALRPVAALPPALSLPPTTHGPGPATQYKPPNALARLGPRDRRAVFSPFNFRQILELVLFLPLNFIPFVGVPLYMILTGYRAGPLQHWRYHKFLGLGKKRRIKFVEEWRNKYSGFGTMHLTMQLVPGLNMLFLLTSAAGAALFADLLETKRRETLPAPIVAADGHVVEHGAPVAYGATSSTRK